MASDSQGTTHHKTLQTRIGTSASVSATPLVRENRVRTTAPEELVGVLKSVVKALWFMSISSIGIIILSGFRLWGFSLDRSIIIAIVGGVSLQYVAAIVSPLVRGISEMVIAQIRSRQS